MILLKTSKGDIKIQLDEKNTPVTAQNFLNYVKDKFYDDTIFHRVISGFMIQGGGFNQKMQQKGTQKPIQNEAKSGMKNKRGTIAMARTNDPHSATAQFFINLVDNDFLNFSGENLQGWGYCVFGEVVEGMDVVDAIAKVKTGAMNGHRDVPVENVVIHSAEIVE
jgi:peptidyl-prolyl cis-trans isomerase B (cyclophilin B)